MVLGIKVAIFDLEWAEIRPLEMGRISSGLYKNLEATASACVAYIQLQLSWCGR